MAFNRADKTNVNFIRFLACFSRSAEGKVNGKSQLFFPLFFVLLSLPLPMNEKQEIARNALYCEISFTLDELISIHPNRSTILLILRFSFEQW